MMLIDSLCRITVFHMFPTPGPQSTVMRLEVDMFSICISYHSVDNISRSAPKLTGTYSWPRAILQRSFMEICSVVFCNPLQTNKPWHSTPLFCSNTPMWPSTAGSTLAQLIACQSSLINTMGAFFFCIFILTSKYGKENVCETSTVNHDEHEPYQFIAQWRA